jgi:HEAT repeat protein
LGYSRNIEALEALFHKLSDSNESVRVVTVTALTRLAPKGHPKTLQMLFQQIDNESSERVISTILMGLGKMCSGADLMRIAKFLQHRDERIVANAIEALSGSDDPKTIDLLIPFVVSRNNRVKANAAMALFAKGRVEVLDTLKPMFELQSCVSLLVSLLKDPETLVKRQAIIALGKTRDKSAVLPLLDNLNLETDSKELVHDVAEALRSIGSHRLVREVVRTLG